MPDKSLAANSGIKVATAPVDAIDTAKCIAVSGEGLRTCTANLVREEPLEIQIQGQTILVTMRTPGHDIDLAHGILRSECIIESADEVQAMHHCSTATNAHTDGNLLKITLRPGSAVDFAALQRNFMVSSSCGLCGKTAVENTLKTAPPLTDASQFSVVQISGLPELFHREQILFSATGGAHAAALFSAHGELLVLREDVGRHNAVDKVLGWASRNRLLPQAGLLLMVSGRISFEIAQKALVARVPVVAGISAPTSLAVELAANAKMTLVGFLRKKEMNLYGHTQRIVGAQCEP